MTDEKRYSAFLEGGRVGVSEYDGDVGVYSRQVLWQGTPREFAELVSQVRDLTGERDRFRLWANCGGVATGRKCACPEEVGHEIFGAHIQTGPEEFWCELHHYRKEIAGLRDTVERLERDQKASELRNSELVEGLRKMDRYVQILCKVLDADFTPTDVRLEVAEASKGYGDSLSLLTPDPATTNSKENADAK